MQKYIDMRLVGCGVYSITCTMTNRVYIGSTSSFERRWQEHKEQLRLGIHHSWKLQRDYTLFGPDAFVFAILERCHPTQRLEREQFYITRYGAAVTGYNVAKFTQPADMRGRVRPDTSTRSAIKNLRKKQLG